MKYSLLVALLLFFFAFFKANAQEETGGKSVPDTTRMNFGNTEVIIITHGEEWEGGEDSSEPTDTIDAAPEEDGDDIEAHWSGVDLGFGMLLNNQYGTDFGGHKYWNTDPAKSVNFNLNLLEHKFSIYKNYVGVTTGLGFNFTQIAFNDNYILKVSPDSVYATIDTVATYSKNKLKASYLTAPILIEFCTSSGEEKSFYLATGVVGGVRIGSKVKRIGKIEGKEFEQIEKGVYGLNAFKLDAMVRMGYNSWGVYAAYSLLPVFDDSKTDAIHPINFGLTYNF